MAIFSFYLFNFFVSAFLRLLTYFGFFSKTWSELSEVFWYMERSKNLEKNFHNRAKKFIFLRRFDRRNTFLGIDKSNSKRLFLNDSKCKS